MITNPEIHKERAVLESFKQEIRSFLDDRFDRFSQLVDVVIADSDVTVIESQSEELRSLVRTIKTLFDVFKSRLVVSFVVDDNKKYSIKGLWSAVYAAAGVVVVLALTIRPVAVKGYLTSYGH